MHARMNPTRPSSDAAMAGAVRARALLIIEDDPPIRRALRNALGDVAERLLEAPTGKTGIDIAATERPDLVILDLGLPDLEGVAVCREIRSWSPVPIVVLSARHSDAEKVQLLNAGADDYITKPFSTAEFVARVRAVLRRARSPGAADVPATVEAYGLTIDLVHRRVTRAGTAIRLTPIEWDILRTLVANAGRTLTHQQIFEAVWGAAAGSPQQYLRGHITDLRRKTEARADRPELLPPEPGAPHRADPPRQRPGTPPPSGAAAPGRQRAGGRGGRGWGGGRTVPKLGGKPTASRTSCSRRCRTISARRSRPSRCLPRKARVAASPGRSRSTSRQIASAGWSRTCWIFPASKAARSRSIRTSTWPKTWWGRRCGSSRAS